MATDQHLKRIEALLSPNQGESSGYITRDDLLAAFREALLATAEQEIPQEDVVIAALQQPSGNGGESLLQVVSSLSDVLARWDANIDVMGGQVPTVLPDVGGEAVPSTVAQTAQVLNNLIAALSAMGLVRDVRTAAPAAGGGGGTPTTVAITGLSAPTLPAVVFTFAPANATLPNNLAALVADATVGDATLAAATQAPFTRAQYIVLADGSRATFDGTNWSAWTPPITGLQPPATGSKQWTFVPVGAVVLVDLPTLKADATVGDAALTAAGNVDFTSGEYLTLGDSSTAYFGADATAGPGGGYSWQVGVAP